MNDYHKLDTPFGPVWIHPVCQDDIYVSTTPPESRNAEPITVNRIECTLGGHVTYTPDRGWWGTDLYIRRTRTFDYVSASAEQKIRDTLGPLVATWAKAHPQLLVVAQRTYLKNRIQNLEDKKAEHFNAIKALKDNIEALQALIDSLS